VSDILDLSRLEAGQRPLRLARFNLETVVRETLDSVLPAAKARQIGFDLEIEPGMVAEADPDLLRRLLINLTGNAVKYSPVGGQITVSAQTRGDEWFGFVEDHGPGIPPEDLPHVFERFFRADPSRTRDDETGGAGLGLAIVRSIVEAHGGTASVASEHGRGATFTLRIPLSEASGSTVKVSS
jgi:signal transduction histidine kinase